MIIQGEDCTEAVLGNTTKKLSKIYSQHLRGIIVTDVICQVIKDLKLPIEPKGQEDFLISWVKI